MTNQSNPTDFTARISSDDPQRAAVWRAVFESDEVPLRSPIPAYANLPEGRGKTLVYDLDIAALTAEQRTRLVLHISGRFDVPAGDVEAQLDVIGVPILAEDVTITIERPWRWVYSHDDDFDDDDSFDAWQDEDELAYLFDDDYDDEDLMP